VPTSIGPASRDPVAIAVDISGPRLRVTLADGREIAAPLEWFPTLRKASEAQRANWRLIGRGQGIYWPDVDEEVSVRQLLGEPS
jgi:hypothetical protein